MPRKSNNIDTALVQVYERDYAKGVRFYLHYSLNGEQVREPLKNIPLVPRKDRIAFREARLIAERTAAERMEEIRKGGIRCVSMVSAGRMTKIPENQVPQHPNLLQLRRTRRNHL